MKDILLLEDDRAYRESMAEYLESLGFSLEAYENGDDAHGALFERSFKLALLDVRVPGKSGLEILKAVRENGLKTAVILVTSLTDIDDLSIGYELGCNDYIRKPFELKELRYRITQALAAVAFGSLDKTLDLGRGYRFEVESGVLYREGDAVELTRREREVVAYLIAQKGRWVEAEELRSEVWEMKEVAYADIRMSISRIRAKAGRDLIETARGLGYRIAF
ncbi:MAG: response regulator transcription factor [Campylobacterales bacterium]